MKIEIEKPIVPKWFDDWYKDVPAEQDGYGATKEEHAIQLVSQVGWGNGLYKSMSNLKREDEERVSYVLDNKTKLFHAILFGYEIKQEPKYYARIKGYELINDEYDIVYWMVDKQDNSLFVSELPQFSFDPTSEYGYITELTSHEWNELGVYDDANAVFILKEDMSDSNS